MATLNIPPSNSIVRVRAINARTDVSLHSFRFFEPSLPGFETLNLTSVCFLIEHSSSGKTILFDCGARKDYENYPPVIKARLNTIIKGIKIEADVNDILEEAGIKLEDIDAIVWSHWHWDHVGAAENFPKQVDIVVGPGFKKNFMPGYPTNPESPLLDVNFEGRKVREISFTDTGIRIGQFDAFDFFGDGSFYLLDSPGHAIGHMCGLARTTPSTFVFTGGDICHYSGMFRPSSGVQLPDPIPSDQLDVGLPSPCPCSFFASQNPRAEHGSTESTTTPFFEVTSAKPASYLDRETAMQSIIRMQDFDASPNVLVCIAHDPTLVNVLPFLNDQPKADINDWKERGYKGSTLWGWLNDLPRDGKPGRPILVDGTVKDGEQVTDFTKLSPSR